MLVQVMHFILQFGCSLSCDPNDCNIHEFQILRSGVVTPSLLQPESRNEMKKLNPKEGSFIVKIESPINERTLFCF